MLGADGQIPTDTIAPVVSVAIAEVLLMDGGKNVNVGKGGIITQIALSLLLELFLLPAAWF